MDEDGFVCPYPWKWNEIHERLVKAWQVRCEELKAMEPEPIPEPEPEPEPDSSPVAATVSSTDFDLDFGEEDEPAWDAAVIHIEEELPPIPEPPHLLAPTSTDPIRHQRWQETVAWAEEYGFSHLIGTLAESDKYYAA